MKSFISIVVAVIAANILSAQQPFEFERTYPFDYKSTFRLSSILYQNDSIYAVLSQTDQLWHMDYGMLINHLLKFDEYGNMVDSVLIDNSYQPSDFLMADSPVNLKLYSKPDSIILYGNGRAFLECLSDTLYGVFPSTPRRCQIDLSTNFELGYASNFLEDTECGRFSPLNFFFSNTNSESYYISTVDTYTDYVIKYQIKDSNYNILFEKRSDPANNSIMYNTRFFEKNGTVKLYSRIPNGILVMDKFMNATDTFMFPEISSSIYDIVINQDYIAFKTALSVDYEVQSTHIYVINHSGEIILDNVFPGQVRDYTFSGNNLLAFSYTSHAYDTIVTETQPIMVYRLDLSTGQTFYKKYGFPFAVGNEIRPAADGYFLIGGGIYYQAIRLPVPFQNKGYLLSSKTDFINTPYYLAVPDLTQNVTFSIQPNPFNDSFSLSFDLSRNGTVTISVADITGRKLISTEKQNLASGSQHLNINAEALPQGIYFCTLSTNGYSEIRRVIKQ